MVRRLLLKIEFKYLILIFLSGLIFSFQLSFLSIFFILLRLFVSLNKIIYLILSYIFLTFAFFDFFAPQIFLKESDYFTNSNIDYDINKHFGYYPKKNSEFTEQVYFKGNLLKTNIYSINKYGHRKTLNVNLEKSSCIIFYGGSIIFGQSLNDNETLPYFVSKKLKSKTSVFNYSFNGYGPHQFLSKIENNYVNELKNCETFKFVYFYIHDHIGRTVGKRSWGINSPRYVLDGNRIYQKGFFSTYPYKFIMKFRKNIRNSKIISTLYDVNKSSKKDEYLFVRILEKIEKKTKEIYFNSEFIYIFWNKENLNLEIVNNFFKNKKILEIDKLNIPTIYHSNNIPGDNHPTKKFNDLLSQKFINFLSLNK